MNDDTLGDTAQVLPFKPKVTSGVKPAPIVVDDGLVSMVEGLLEAVKSGQITFVAVAAVDRSGVACSTWEPSEMESSMVTQALGSIGFLSHRLHASANEGSEDEPRFRA